MKHQLQLITAALLVQNQNNPWRVADPITVRLSDNDFHIMYIYGLQVSPKRELYVMVMEETPIGRREYRIDENWIKVEESDVNAAKIISAIHERIMKVFKTAEVAA